jgi:hypothetical protein
MPSTQPYTYSLLYIASGAIQGYRAGERFLYYGARYGKGCHPVELGDGYLTSSSVVKSLLKRDAQGVFKWKVRRLCATRDEALKHEAKFLTRVGAADDPKWLNKCNGGKDFRTNWDDEAQRTRQREAMKARWEVQTYRESMTGDNNVSKRQATRDKVRLSALRLVSSGNHNFLVLTPEQLKARGLSGAKNRIEKGTTNLSWKWVHNLESGQSKVVKFDEVTSHLDNGWKLGRIYPKHQLTTPEQKQARGKKTLETRLAKGTTNRGLTTIFNLT